MPTPEELAREKIDQQLTAAGWAVQNDRAYATSSFQSIAHRQVHLASGHCNSPVGKTGTRRRHEHAIAELVATDPSHSGLILLAPAPPPRTPHLISAAVTGKIDVRAWQPREN